jgi:hypothetical protein
MKPVPSQRLDADVHSITSNISQLEPIKMTINWWRDKQKGMYVYTMEYSSAVTWNELLAYTSHNTDDPRNVKWKNKTQKTMYYIWSFQTRQILMHRKWTIAGVRLAEEAEYKQIQDTLWSPGRCPTVDRGDDYITLYIY